MLKEPQYGVTFVYDGSEEPIIPGSMGEPRRDHKKKGDQAIGSHNEIVTELAGRACYDSLGKGRSSEEYHEHIREVNHNSVWGHSYHHFEVYGDLAYVLAGCLINEPGIVLTDNMAKNDKIFMTINVRALVYQASKLRYLEKHDRVPTSAVMVIETLLHMAAQVDPQLLEWVPLKWGDITRSEVVAKRLDLNAVEAVCHAAHVRLGGTWTLEQVMQDPERKEFLAHGYTVWYLEGFSRGWSHEHVRHTKEIGISQRSTRYVDESESDWAWHPLIHQFVNDPDADAFERDNLVDGLETAEQSCRIVYDENVFVLQKYVQQKQPGIDRTSARKQARGAMRGALGNALPTSMMWSVSLSELLFHYMPQRHSRYADAEIRVFANMLGEELQQRYPEVFGHLSIRESPDGLAGEWTGWTEPMSHNNPYPEW